MDGVQCSGIIIKILKLDNSVALFVFALLWREVYPERSRREPNNNDPMKKYPIPDNRFFPYFTEKE